MKVTTPACMVCDKRSVMEVDSTAYFRWQQQGWLIQSAFPDMPEDLREQLKTGTHPACWDEMFGPDDDEEDGCPGHPDDDYSILAGKSAGQTHYCDGSCR